MNLLKETQDVLKQNEKTLDDVVWIGCEGFKITKEQFIELADIDYDDDFGSQEVATDLIIVGEDWYMTRGEYDGSEWWDFHTRPSDPGTTREIFALTVRQSVSGRVGWCDLDELNQSV
jgi:hypothetical protein